MRATDFGAQTPQAFAAELDAETVQKGPMAAWDDPVQEFSGLPRLPTEREALGPNLSRCVNLRRQGVSFKKIGTEFGVGVEAVKLRLEKVPSLWRKALVGYEGEEAATWRAVATSDRMRALLRRRPS